MSSGNGSIASHQYAKTTVSATAPGITFTTNGNWGSLGNSINLSGKLKVYQDPSVKKEKKKMGWLKRKIAKWAQEGREDYVDYDRTIKANIHEGVSGKTSVRFTIYPASGGFVIEHYKQDRYKDSEGPELTIVNNSDSLGTAVEHILTMEALKS